MARNISYYLTSTTQDIPYEHIAFDSDESICADHIITAMWAADATWSSLEPRQYRPLSLLPTSYLHYTLKYFEGMKVYRGFDGKL